MTKPVVVSAEYNRMGTLILGKYRKSRLYSMGNLRCLFSMTKLLPIVRTRPVKTKSHDTVNYVYSFTPFAQFVN